MELLLTLLDGTRRTFPWLTDNDSRRRQCTVKLMVRQIDGGVAEHWALYFDWTDRAATYEANDEDGYLIPYWNRGYPDVTYMWKMSRRFSLDCSPKQVNSKARQISLNGLPYLLTDRNCHHWAIELASQVGLNIDEALESYLPGDLKSVINFGYAINNATQCFSQAGSLFAGSTVSSNTGHARALARTAPEAAMVSTRVSRASARATDGADGRQLQRISSDNSTEQTFKAVAGAVMFAVYAIGTLLKNIAGDEDEFTNHSV
jgi:hypothetical protein